MVFPLVPRIPVWAEGAQRRAGDLVYKPAAGTFFCLSLRLTLPMQIRLQIGHWGLILVYRGPLVFRLKGGEQVQMVGGAEPHVDWEVYPSTPWNYGRVADLQNATSGFEVEGRPVGSIPFKPDSAPVTLRVLGKRLPEGPFVDNSAGPIRGGPHHSSESPPFRESVNEGPRRRERHRDPRLLPIVSKAAEPILS